MALAETANLIVKLSLGGNFVSQIGKATKGLDTFDRKSSRAFRAGEQIGTGIKRGAILAAAGVGLLASQVAVGLQSLIELEKATTQTEAVIRSTGAAAGVTATEVRRLAEKYEALNATIGDEAIQAGENLLLTYTAIRKEAFEPALQAALDLSTALGTDLDAAIKTVGRALSDPAKAVGRLTRAGIVLTKSEQKQIAAHLKNNDALGAQNVILKALETRYGGSFLAGGTTTAGKVAKFSDAIEDLQRSLAVALLPTVSNVADALTELLADPETQRGAEELGKTIASLFTKQNIKEGVSAIREGAGFLLTIAREVGGVVKVAVDAFRSLPPELQKLAVGAFAVNKLTGGLVTNLAGGLISAVLSSFKGVLGVTAGVVNVTGPVVGGPGAVAGAAKGGLGLLSKVFLVGEAIGLAILVNEVRQGISDASTAQATAIQTQTERFIASQPPRDALQNALNGVEQGIHDLEFNPLNVLVQGEALDRLRAMQANLKAALADRGANGRDSTTQAETTKGNVFGPQGLDQSITDAQKAAANKVTTAVETMRGKIADELGIAKSSITDEVSTVRTATTAGAGRIATGAAVGASRIVSAIQANRPIISVNVSSTSITRVTEVTNRYGTPLSSRNIRQGAD